MYRDDPIITEAMLSHVKVPVNLISGSFGRLSSRAVNDVLGERFKRGPHILIPGGYAAPALYPEVFAQAVRFFLEKLPLTGSASRT